MPSGLIRGNMVRFYCTDRSGTGKDLSSLVKTFNWSVNSGALNATGANQSMRTYSIGTYDFNITADFMVHKDVFDCFHVTGNEFNTAATSGYYEDLLIKVYIGPGARTGKGATGTSCLVAVVNVDSCDPTFDLQGEAQMSVSFRLSHLNNANSAFWVPATDNTKALRGTADLKLTYTNDVATVSANALKPLVD